MSDARQSQEIGELAKALALAQGEIKAPKKDKVGKVKGTNRHGQAYEYEYRYSDLAALFDAVREPFAKHGLSFMQPLRFDDGHVVLETVLLHESGQWRRSEYPIPAELVLKPQEFGSALTYGRRYSASGLFGVASDEDDDGSGAQAVDLQREDKQKKDKPKASALDANIVEVAESIVMTFGGNADELIGRASAFPKTDDPEEKKAQAAKLDAERWTAERKVVLAPHNQYIKGADKLPKSEKWKKGTLARLIARRDALRKEPTEAELQAEMEGRDAEGDLFQPSSDDVPF